MRRFDESSGQIYDETTLAAPSSSDALWFKRPKSQAVRGRRMVTGAQPPRLFDLALRSAIANSSSITAESLDGVPWKIARQIWKAIVDS